MMRPFLARMFRTAAEAATKVEGAAPSAPLNSVAVTAHRPPTISSRAAMKRTDICTVFATATIIFLHASHLLAVVAEHPG